MIPMGAGGVTDFEDYGMSEIDHERAQRDSDVARFAPEAFGASTRGSWEEPWEQILAVQKPEEFSLAGDDVFGPPTFSATTRNMLYDLRGEVAYAQLGSAGGGYSPESGDVSWRDYAAANGPSSTMAACGTCGAEYSGKSYGSSQRTSFTKAQASQPYTGFWNRVKTAFFV